MLVKLKNKPYLCTMSNKEIADKIYDSYFSVTKKIDKDTAKEHANAILDAQISLMCQGEDIKIIDTERELFVEDYEEIRLIINLK